MNNVDGQKEKHSSPRFFTMVAWRFICDIKNESYFAMAMPVCPLCPLCDITDKIATFAMA